MKKQAVILPLVLSVVRQIADCLFDRQRDVTRLVENRADEEHDEPAEHVRHRPKQCGPELRRIQGGLSRPDGDAGDAIQRFAARRGIRRNALAKIRDRVPRIHHSRDGLNDHQYREHE